MSRDYAAEMIGVLALLKGGPPVAAQALNAAVGRSKIKTETMRTRSLLHTMREAGLVEGLADRCGSIRRWKITQAGLAHLASAAKPEK